MRHVIKTEPDRKIPMLFTSIGNLSVIKNESDRKFPMIFKGQIVDSDIYLT